jgi:chromosome segregation ATPase
MYDEELKVKKEIIELAKRNESKSSETLSKMMQIHKANKQLAMSNSSLKSEIERLNKAMSELSNNTDEGNKGVKTSISKLEEDNKKHQSALVEKDLQIQSLKKEIASLTEQNNSLNKDNIDLVKALQTTQKEANLEVYLLCRMVTLRSH